MTVRELIKALQDLGEENLDKEVLIYDEYRYVYINDMKNIEEPGFCDETDVPFIGIN